MDRNVSFPMTTGRRTLGFRDERSLREAVFGSKDFVQRMKLDKTLDVHRGCVNTISWNEQGSLILSGSDDKKLCFTDPYSSQLVASIPTGHRSNIFSAKFLPCTRDRQVVSCSGDGCIIYSDVDSQETGGQNTFNCHYGTAYEVITLPSDPNTFMSCGEDGTVRWFDLRRKTSCMKEECKEDVMINCRRAVTAVSVNPVLPYQLAVGCSDSSVRIFDRRMLGTRLTGNHVGRGIQGILCRFCPAHLQNKYSRPTSLTYSANGQDLLVSYASDYIYLFGTNARYRQEDGEMMCGADDGLIDDDPCAAADKDEGTPGHPVKRLRLRGDWSDTGPRARPRSEIPEEERPRPTMVQRMSEMLSRWLEDSSSSSSARPRRPGDRIQDDPATAPSTSSPGNREERSQAAMEQIAATGVTDVGARIREMNRAAKETAAGPSRFGSSRGAEADSQGLDDRKAGTSKGKEGGKKSAIDEERGKGTERRTELEAKDSDSKKGSKESLSLRVDRKQVDSSASRSVSQISESQDTSPSLHKSGEALDSTARRKGENTDGQSKENDKRKANGEDETTDGQSKESNEGTAKGENGTESQQDVGRGRSDREEEKKGIFALGDRMEDRNPQPRLTKQDSLEHTRARKKSVADTPPNLPAGVSSATASRSEAGSADDRGKDQGKADSGEGAGREGRGGEGEEESGAFGSGSEREKRGKDSQESGSTKGESTPTTASSSSSQSTSGRSRSVSSQSVTCSESDSEEEMTLLGAEREKKSPQSRDAPAQPRHRVRSEAELRLRELFKTRKQERETEAEMIKNVYSPSVEMVYRGHRNSRTMIKEANFWGDHYVVSGSDCGHIFFWDRYTAQLVMLLEGDRHVVNCIQPHPLDPLLATSGIDYNVKLWSPIAEEPCLPENAYEVMRINELMLEETRDTITVPPSFMLRMLASLNHLRGDRRRSRDPLSTSESSDD